MIVYNRENKKLVIPNALGNFGNAGGGSGSGLTPEEVAEIASAVTEAAIEEYDTEIQVDLEDIRENLSATTEDLAALSAYTATISGKSYDNEIEALSGSVNDIRSDVGTLSGATNNILSDIEALSGITESVSAAVDTLSGITTANTENIATLSAATEAISGSLGNYATTAVTDALSGAVDGKQDTLTPSSGISIDADSNISANIGNGIGFDANNALQVKIGEGLAFSGNTLVVSGISGGGGIEKVDSLPSTAQEGDIVWLNGHTETGFTFYASWSDWGATGTLGYVDGNEVYFDGERTIFGHWGGNNIRFRRDADHLYADYLGGSSASVSGADGVNSNIEFPFIGSFYAFRNGMWTKVATDYVIDFNAADPVCKQVFLEIYEGLSDFDGSNLVIRYVQDSSWPYPREFRPYSARWYGVDCQSSDDRVSPAMDGYYGRISIDINRLTYNYQEDSLDFGTLVGTKQTASAEEVSSIKIYKPVFVRFGNDDRGGLTYDADNNRFEYDSGYITPGDTTSAYPDLIDKLFTDYIFDGGSIWTGAEYLYPQNTNKFVVIKNGETKTYAAPRMTRRQLSSTVTIDGVDFDWEVTYDYSDWTLTAYYAGNGRNNAANLRISANA